MDQKSAQLPYPEKVQHPKEKFRAKNPSSPKQSTQQRKSIRARKIVGVSGTTIYDIFRFLKVFLAQLYKEGTKSVIVNGSWFTV